MKLLFKKIAAPIPGMAAALVIAALAWFLESLLPIHVVGAAVMAMFIGMIVNHFLGKRTAVLSAGLKFSIKMACDTGSRPPPPKP